MTNLQAKLQELRTLAEGKLVECPGEFVNGGSEEEDRLPCEQGYIECGYEEYHYPGGTCPYCGPNRGKGIKHTLCKGTGHIPDPAYSALLEVLREKCQGWYEDLGDAPGLRGGWVTSHTWHWCSENCKSCGGTGFVTRSWD